jgi:hypothetical protein
MKSRNNEDRHLMISFPFVLFALVLCRVNVRNNLLAKMFSITINISRLIFISFVGCFQEQCYYELALTRVHCDQRQGVFSLLFSVQSSKQRNFTG